ncbi:MAG: hypothetical protein LQ338_006699 [Usnochroma carphineum]|nr:MAG: hypothetical protein LQ338_006699 [Usnochroma carphineum]
MTPPYITISQFISAAVGFGTGGKNVTTQARIKNRNAKTLTMSPDFPRSKRLFNSSANHHPAFSSMSGSNQRNVRIVKPGYTVGSISSGAIAKRSDFIWRLIAGCVEIGAYNRDEADHWLFISDVDRVARRVVSAVFEKTEGEGVAKSEGQQRCNGHAGSVDRDGGNIEASANPGRDSRQVHRVLDGLPFSEVWTLLTEELGYPPLQALGKKEWLSRLRGKVIESGEKHVLFPLLDVLERSGDEVGEKIWPHADHVAGVGEMKEVVESNLRYLIETDFMPPPPLVVENGAT